MRSKTTIAAINRRVDGDASHPTGRGRCGSTMIERHRRASGLCPSAGRRQCLRLSRDVGWLGNEARDRAATSGVRQVGLATREFLREDLHYDRNTISSLSAAKVLTSNRGLWCMRDNTALIAPAHMTSRCLRMKRGVVRKCLPAKVRVSLTKQARDVARHIAKTRPT